MTPQELLPLLQRAVADHEAGRTDDAEAIYRRILAEHPDNADALHLMGVLLTQRGRPAEACRCCIARRWSAPNFAQAHFHLGQALAEMNRHNNALGCYARALQLDPRYAMVRTQAGSSLMSLGRLNEALDQFRIATQMEPNNGGFLGNYGFCLYRMGKMAEGAAAPSSRGDDGAGGSAGAPSVGRGVYGTGSSMRRPSRLPTEPRQSLRTTFACSSCWATVARFWPGRTKRRRRIVACWRSSRRTSTPGAISRWSSSRWAMRKSR